jgi:hypothetical protein
VWQVAQRPGWSVHQGRVAWLLRVNRLYGFDERWVRGSHFADAFQGGHWPERTSTYRISRWETAAVRVPYLAVRRYEELLQLPANSLVALIDTIYRYSAQTPGSAPLLDRGLSDAGPRHLTRLEELVETIRRDRDRRGLGRAHQLSRGCAAADDHPEFHLVRHRRATRG